ncbi:MAG: acyl carrier protein [candidate division KSB1 bacterium]|jgi:acyl carrier protein|nr:acyl carrier protein [candidate division KSB1 bacterium]
MSDTLKRVIDVTADLLKIDASAIREESRFVEDLGAESIQSIELVAAFEEEFDIEMDEDEALGVKTVGDAAEFINKVIAGE